VCQRQFVHKPPLLLFQHNYSKVTRKKRWRGWFTVRAAETGLVNTCKMHRIIAKRAVLLGAVWYSGSIRFNDMRRLKAVTINTTSVEGSLVVTTSSFTRKLNKEMLEKAEKPFYLNVRVAKQTDEIYIDPYEVLTSVVHLLVIILKHHS
jgi:bisphosphoglycerate-dependent phosphoglycerate mutase